MLFKKEDSLVMKKVILATALLVSGSALAAGLPVSKPVNPGYLGWFAGVGIVGTSMFDTRSYETIHGTTGTFKQDSNPVGFSLFVGDRFTPNFGAELNFKWLGKLTYKNYTDSAKKYDVNNNYYTFLNGYFYYPMFDQFDLFFKGGAGYVHSVGESTNLVDNTTDRLNVFAVSYGAGLGWHYNNFGLRVDYTQYKPTRSVDSLFKLMDTVGFDVLYTWG